MIEAAVGILLLLIVSYIVLGSITTAADTVSQAGKYVTAQNQARLNTNITISNVTWTTGASYDYLRFNITNTGSEVISNFTTTDVFVANSTDAPKYYRFDSASSPVPGNGSATLGTWAYNSLWPDTAHPRMLDPGEMMVVKICCFGNVHPNTLVGVTTPNGGMAFLAV